MTAAISKPASSRPKASRQRSAARLAAVQALYQMELSPATASLAVDQITCLEGQGRRGDGLETDALVEPDAKFLEALVAGVDAKRSELDGIIAELLNPDWQVGRLEILLRLILEAGLYEMTARPDIPPRVIITEYVDVAHAFYSGPEPGLVNGILDRSARRFRADEIEAPGKAG